MTQAGLFLGQLRMLALLGSRRRRGRAHVATCMHTQQAAYFKS